MRDAVRCHFDDGEAPAIIRLHYVTTHQRGEHHFAESVTDPQARERLLDAIGGSGAFGRFKRVLSSYPDLREQWFRFQEDRLGEYAREWLAEENIDAELTGPRK